MDDAFDAKVRAVVANFEARICDGELRSRIVPRGHPFSNRLTAAAYHVCTGLSPRPSRVATQEVERAPAPRMQTHEMTTWRKS